MKITVNLSDKRINDLLHGHGGRHSPWMQSLVGAWDDKTGARIVFDREQDDEGTFKGRRTIKRAAVNRGLALMALNAPDSFADFINEKDDDLTFDLAWQYIVFGKEVYG